MKREFMLMLLSILCSISLMAQTDSYYYYRGTKIPLTLNEDKICVSIAKEHDMVSERIRANVQVLRTIENNAIDLFVISRSDFENLTSQEFWVEDAKSVILSSCYFTENYEEVATSPYLTVKLKNEEDQDLLTSYAEQYKLRIVGNDPYLPLWYILSLTPESEKAHWNVLMNYGKAKNLQHQYQISFSCQTTRRLFQMLRLHPQKCLQISTTSRVVA